GGWPCWWTRRTIWSSADAACTAPSWTSSVCTACAVPRQPPWARRWTDWSATGGSWCAISSTTIRCSRSCRTCSCSACRNWSVPSPTIWPSSPRAMTPPCCASIWTLCCSAAWPSILPSIRSSISACGDMDAADCPPCACATCCRRGRVAAAHSSTLFSATLTPARYQQDMLGLPEGTRWLDVASPFSPEQLQVRYVSNLSTRYQHRADSLLPICQLIAEQYRQRPGNYLAFFSSYRYLEQ